MKTPYMTATNGKLKDTARSPSLVAANCTSFDSRNIHPALAGQDLAGHVTHVVAVAYLSTPWLCR